MIEPYIPPSTQTDKHEELINNLLERMERLERIFQPGNAVVYNQDAEEDQNGTDQPEHGS